MAENPGGERPKSGKKDKEGKGAATRQRSGFSRRDFLAGAAVLGVVGIGSHQLGRTDWSVLTGSDAAPTGGTGTVPVTPAEPVAPSGPAAPTGPARMPPIAADPPLQPFRDALRVPPVLRPEPDGTVSRLVVPLRSAEVPVHSQLPPTPMWTYGGTFPGPTIEVRSGERTHVEWRNELSGTIPLTAALPPLGEDENAPVPWDIPGRNGAATLPEVERLTPWTATHLHGAGTGGNNDGWSENGTRPGEYQVSEYPNRQRASAAWYHDHAMHVTRLNTHAGLGAGFWIVRDDEEAALKLPSGAREIPLVICDRNFDSDGLGGFNGKFLYSQTLVIPSADNEAKVDLVRTFTGPFVLVNGVVWPFFEVAPQAYRFRVLNASEGRDYELRLFDDAGSPAPDGTIVQIGTDGGLLGAPQPVAGNLFMVPAERTDIVIDFSPFAGRTLTLVNNHPIDPGPWPYVMQFRVADDTPAARWVPPATLSSTFRRVDPAQLTFAADRYVVVVPTYPQGPGYWEMEPAELPAGATLPLDGYVQVARADGSVLTLRRISKGFNDGLNFVGRLGTWERWHFLSLELEGGVPHPIHLHAYPFQVIASRKVDVETFEYFSTPDGGYGGGTATPLKHLEDTPIKPGDTGWKDVVALVDQHMITLAVHLDGPTGRFMHHCHNYNHEDHRMMRPFVVMPDAVMALDPGLAQSVTAESAQGHGGAAGQHGSHS